MSVRPTKPKKAEDIFNQSQYLQSPTVKVMNYKEGQEPKENEFVILFSEKTQRWDRGYYYYNLTERCFQFSVLNIGGVYIAENVTYWFYAGDGVKP